jgi:DNA-binding NtrC family response regulator
VESIRLLVIDDDPQTLDLIAAALEQEGLDIITESDAERGLEIARRQRPHIVLTDLAMPKLSGMELLERVIAVDPTTEVILITAHYSTESAVEAIQKGACDYLNKPLSIQRLRERIGGLITDLRQRWKARAIEEELLHASQYEGIIGRSPLMHEVFARMRRASPHFRTILISGATGSGKELVARALHRLSPAASGPFVVCNCAAVTETLAESELFGYVRGAFTGAHQDKVGLFEFANNGTLLLDEIGEMPLSLQAKLLRAVQNQEVQRVGSPQPRRVNVRVIAATHRNLRELAAQKQFREDLYFRLCMVELKLPTLNERREDLPLLIRHFVELFSKQYNKPIEGLTRRCEALLARYSWPGNVRELENVIGYACMMAETSRIDLQDLPEHLQDLRGPGLIAEELLSLEEMERLHTRRVLEAVGGNKQRAAEVLGVSRATLYRLLQGKEPLTEKK